MHLEGSQRIAASPERIWEALNDPDVLARCTPGVKRLDLEAEDRYRATLQLGIGPVRGNFQGRVEVRDKAPPDALTLYLEGQGPTGTVRAEGRIQLNAAEEGQTDVAYTGDAQLFGPLAGLGARVMQGVAKTLANQFFKALEREVTQR